MRNNGLVSIGVGTWRRPRTTSLSILLLFSLCISQSDKHSIIKIALQSELEASLLLPDGRHVFFFGFCRYCWLLSWRVFRVFELHWLFNTSLIADSSISRAQLRAVAWRLNLLAYFPPPICVVDNNILSAVLSTRSIFMVLREKKPYIIITLAKDRATMAL